jgi:hypothetical protein
VSSKADQARIASIFLATQLADVQLSSLLAHVGGPGIADVGVVRPDDGFTVLTGLSQYILERFEHVLVALVPGFARAKIHRPVVAFRISD